MNKSLLKGSPRPSSTRKSATGSKSCKRFSRYRRTAFQPKANPELLFSKLKTNAYKFSWALIPISVPFVWLLFPFTRRFKLYDHTVFVTYSLCFMMLLLSAGTLVARGEQHREHSLVRAAGPHVSAASGA